MEHCILMGASDVLKESQRGSNYLVMCHPVVIKVTRGCKTFAADGTLMRFLTTVDPPKIGKSEKGYFKSMFSIKLLSISS